MTGGAGQRRRVDFFSHEPCAWVNRGSACQLDDRLGREPQPLLPSFAVVIDPQIDHHPDLTHASFRAYNPGSIMKWGLRLSMVDLRSPRRCACSTSSRPWTNSSN
jgi:hypothetical protein